MIMDDMSNFKRLIMTYYLHARSRLPRMLRADGRELCVCVCVCLCVCVCVCVCRDVAHFWVDGHLSDQKICYKIEEHEEEGKKKKKKTRKKDGRKKRIKTNLSDQYFGCATSLGE